MNVELREKKGAVARRETGVVPGVVYGSSIEPTMIQAHPLELTKAVKTFGKNRTFKIKLGKKEHQVYIKDYTVNPLRRTEFYSFDLKQVTADDTISAEIPVNVLGKDKFGATSKLLLQLITPAIVCEYPVGQGINSIDVDVSVLSDGDAIYVRDLTLPEGYKVITDHDTMVVNITLPTYREETTETDVSEEADVEETPEEETE